MQFPILIGLRRSAFQGRFLLCLFSVVVFLPWLVEWPLAVQAALSVFALIASCVTMRCLPRLPEVLLLERTGKMAIRHCQHDNFMDVEVLPGVTVHRWLTVISYRAVDHKKCEFMVIFPDCLDSNSFRRLRVWLRHAAGNTEGAATADSP